MRGSHQTPTSVPGSSTNWSQRGSAAAQSSGPEITRIVALRPGTVGASVTVGFLCARPRAGTAHVNTGDGRAASKLSSGAGSGYDRSDEHGDIHASRRAVARPP